MLGIAIWNWHENRQKRNAAFRAKQRIHQRCSSLWTFDWSVIINPMPIANYMVNYPTRIYIINSFSYLELVYLKNRGKFPNSNRILNRTIIFTRIDIVSSDIFSHAVAAFMLPAMWWLLCFDAGRYNFAFTSYKSLLLSEINCEFLWI